MNKPSGLITAIITPFNENQQLDEKGIESVLEHVLAGGVDGLFILGTTGLGPALSVEERMRVAEVMVTTVGKRCFKIVHVGGLNYSDTIKLAKHASTIGADAVAALTPFYYRLAAKEITGYYKHIEESTELPLLIYNIPQNTGYNITPEVTFEVVKGNNRVVGMKDSSGDLSQLIAVKRMLSHTGFSVLNGRDGLVLPSLASGLDGSVTAFSNVIPREFKE
ncbi:MAG TPA: dihydrodipicolinate synthase family protein, partial [Candidatus Caldiarchaeum subterraneum]|nr:dihydrodipicolinate synthase family protein [Candidatus Caldarchaeum subterraneum]